MRNVFQSAVDVLCGIAFVGLVSAVLNTAIRLSASEKLLKNPDSVNAKAALLMF